MVTAISSLSTANNTSPSPADEIALAAKQIIDLLEADKKEDANTTTKQLKSLLIEYIIEKTGGDKEGGKKIEAEIAALLSQYGSDIQGADQLEEKIKAIANDPQDQTQSTLQSLQDLLTTLQSGAGLSTVLNSPESAQFRNFWARS